MLSSPKIQRHFNSISTLFNDPQLICVAVCVIEQQYLIFFFQWKEDWQYWTAFTSYQIDIDFHGLYIVILWQNTISIKCDVSDNIAYLIHFFVITRDIVRLKSLWSTHLKDNQKTLYSNSLTERIWLLSMQLNVFIFRLLIYSNIIIVACCCTAGRKWRTSGILKEDGRWAEEEGRWRVWRTEELRRGGDWRREFVLRASHWHYRLELRRRGWGRYVVREELVSPGLAVGRIRIMWGRCAQDDSWHENHYTTAICTVVHLNPSQPENGHTQWFSLLGKSQ